MAETLLERYTLVDELVDDVIPDVNDKTRVCYSRDEVKALIKEIEISTETRFVVLCVDKRFNDDNWEPPSNKRCKIFFEKKNDIKTGKFPPISYDGVPFMFIGTWFLECHKGKDRALKTKEQYYQRSLEEAKHRVIKRRKFCGESTKKIGCPARLTVTRIAKFPKYKLKKDTRWARNQIASTLKRDLIFNKEKVIWEDLFYVYLPSVEEHLGHPVLIGEVSSEEVPMSEDVKVSVNYDPDSSQNCGLGMAVDQSISSMPPWLRTPIRGVLLDITGVLYESGEGLGTVIPGSVSAVRRLHEAGIPVRLVTNETCATRSEIVSKLWFHGFSITEADIFSPVPAMLSLLKQKQLSPHLLVHPNIEKEFIDTMTGKPTCVVMGDADENFSFANMNRAFTSLMQMEHPILFSLGYGRYYKHKGQLQLDVGAFANALEFACDIKSEIVGKPSPHFFGAALQDMGISADQAVMVGDDIVSDVGGSQKCGLRGVLVRTGKYTPACEDHPSVKPDFIANNLYQAVEMILHANKDAASLDEASSCSEALSDKMGEADPMIPDSATIHILECSQTLDPNPLG